MPSEDQFEQYEAPVILDGAGILSSTERQRIDMELRTSTLGELAAWCRSLGLSESGTRTDLTRRIREYFNLSEPREQNNESRKVITIESAQTTEYFTIEVIDEDYARLKGDVKISLKDGDAVHKISANEIIFNRTRNIITASGGVIYEKTEDNSTETFRGESITVNIDNWSSIFLDGNSTFDDDGTAYLFSGTVISRSDQDVTVLTRARISNAASDEAYWSIRASKLWLLPGSDFAIFNAVLNVGEIPVLYIPFFYFPGDEVVFHPVVGYRSREGAFIQTTTYILGQPKADSSQSSSLSRILGNTNDKEKELQGLFLRSTGKKSVSQNEVSLKALVDYYVNIGTYVGVELVTPRAGMLNQIDFSFGLGFSRTVSDSGIGYTPYAPDFDGSSDWNESNFFSMSVPFRYRLRFNSGFNGKYGSLTWNIPYYSDPYIDMDFMSRAESMDWMNMIQQGAAMDEATISQNEIGEYRWHMSGNLNPSFPNIAPIITRVSISSISTTLSFKTMRDASVFNSNANSPNRFYYAPDRYTIYNFSGAVAGTPVSVSGSQAAPTRPAAQIPEDPLNGIGIPIPPWITDETTQERIISTELLTPPVLNQTFGIPSAGNMRFSVDYQLSPTSSSELQFMSSNWQTYEDVNWSEVQSVLTNFGGNANLNFRMDHSSGLFNNVVTFSGSGTWREYTYLNEEMFINTSTGEVDEKRMEDVRRQQYSQTNYTSSYTYNGTLKPIYRDPVFGQSNIQYTFRGTLVRSKRFTPGQDGPELTPEWGSWVKEDLSKEIYGLNSHRLSTNIAANIMDKIQNISVGAELPPMNGLVTASSTFRVWISETNMNFRMEKPEGEDEWIIKPFDIRETLRFGRVGSFVHYMVINPELDNEITSLRSTLSLWNLRTEYSMIRTQKSVFEPDPDIGGKWEREGEEKLRPHSLSLSYNHAFNNIRLIDNRMNLSFDVRSSLAFDLQQHTNSNFQFSTTLNLNITNFLVLRMSATSQNAVIFRYFKNVAGMEDLTSMYIEGEQNNVFIDLIDSFNFFDETKRRRSGFKMQRFDLEAEHLLGDWTASFKINFYPYQRPATAGEIPSINITSDITFLVQWKPITEIKTDIGFDGRKERWAVK